VKREIFCSILAAAAVAAQAAVNLVANHSFEGDEIAFAWGRMETPRERVKAKDDPRYASGFDSTRAKDGKRSYLFRCDNPMGRNTAIFTKMPVVPGKRYTFRAFYWIDNVEGSTMVWGNTHQHDAAGKTSGYYNTSHYDTTPGRWNEWTTSFYVPKNSVTTNVELIFGGKMSVWLDAVEFFEDPEPPAAPPVGAVLKGGDGLDLAWLSPVTKAVPKGFPEGLATGDGKVHIDSARNEKESFQLVISAKRGMKGVRLDVNLPGVAVRVREVKFVPVANAKNPAMNRLHPDPVVAFEKGDVGEGENLTLLVTVNVPADAVAGVHVGAIKVSAEGATVAEVPVEMRVRGFSLPSTATLKSYFYSSPGYGGGAYKKFDGRPDVAINDDIHRLYREMRLTGNQALKRPMPKWKLENGRVVVTDWSPYEDEVLRLNREYGFTTIPCPFVGMLGDNAGWFKSKGRGTLKRKNGRTVGDGAPQTPFGGYHDEPTGQGRVIDALGQFLSRAKERFPDITFTWYIYDEPCYDVMDVLPGVIKAYSKALPELNLFIVATPYAAKLPPYHTRVASFCNANINPQIVNFRETWYYQYASTIDDGNYLRNRFYPWQVYMADGCGVLLWNVIYYGSAKKGAHNPWTELTANYDHARPTLFYPPREESGEGTVMSMRAINIADAIDDFDYIKLYEAKVGKDAAKRLISRVLPVPLARPEDAVRFLDVRREMADAIEGL
jgi:hypothetical protein